MVITNRLYWNRKTRDIRPKYTNNGSYSDVLAQLDGWDRMIHKRGRRNAPAPAAAIAAVPPPVPAAMPAAAAATAHPPPADDPNALMDETDRILADSFANAPPSLKKHLHHHHCHQVVSHHLVHIYSQTMMMMMMT